MNLQFYLEQVHLSDAYKDFVNENPKAYLCSGFFTIDKENTKMSNEKQFDFYIPDKKQMFIFKITAEGVEKHPVEMTSPNVPEKISDKMNFDFEKLEETVMDEMVRNNVKNKIQKIMISLQKFEKKEMLVCTIFISMLGLLKVHINPKTNNVELFEKKSLFDMVKRIK